MNSTAGTSIDLPIHGVRHSASAFDDYLLVVPEGRQRALALSLTSRR